MSERLITVFYSWQSDTDEECNWRGIRHALQTACADIEAELGSIRIIVDEATRDTTGSPNIPATIFQKISNCDIIVCDVTTINSEAKDIKRKTPNPNVMVELGYGVAVVGWSRIITLFNKQFGQFPDDLPFDIDRHRISDFLVKDKDDKSGKGNLKALLKKSVQDIIEKNPLKPDQTREIKPEERRRNLDIINLTKILSTIHMPTLDHFIESGASVIHDRIFHFWEGYRAVRDSSLFSLYDEKAKGLVDKIYDLWNKSLSYGDYYRNTGDHHTVMFGSPSDLPRMYREKEVYEIISNTIKELKETTRELFDYIRQEYLEIDLSETSKTAHDEFISYYRKG